jgi:hypothetical protein
MRGTARTAVLRRKSTCLSTAKTVLSTFAKSSFRLCHTLLQRIMQKICRTKLMFTVPKQIQIKPFLTMVTANGIAKNKYAENVQKILIFNDLYDF